MALPRRGAFEPGAGGHGRQGGCGNGGGRSVGLGGAGLGREAGGVGRVALVAGRAWLARGWYGRVEDVRRAGSAGKAMSRKDGRRIPISQASGAKGWGAGAGRGAGGMVGAARGAGGGGRVPDCHFSNRSSNAARARARAAWPAAMRGASRRSRARRARLRAESSRDAWGAGGRRGDGMIFLLTDDVGDAKEKMCVMTIFFRRVGRPG